MKLSDERAAFEAWCFANGLMYESQGIRSESISCDILWRAWQAAVQAERKGAQVVAYLIDWPDEPGLGHYFAEASCETGRSRPLYLHPPQDSATVSIDPLVAEGLEYFEKSGDAGDKEYVAAIRAALAVRATAPEVWRPLLEAVVREIPREGRHGNAPGHGHAVPGIWDRDNGELAGKPCAWCLAWNTAKAMLAAPSRPGDEKEAVK